MTTEADTESVLYQGILWHDRDYALDAKGELYQLRVIPGYLPESEDYWHWLVMGDELMWELGAEKDGAPQLPLKRVVVCEEL